VPDFHHGLLAQSVVDSSSAEILAAAKGTGVSKRSGMLLGGGGGKQSGGVAALAFGSSDFQQTILGEATAGAVKNLAAQLEARIAQVGR
jgi:hypothetical protein